MRVSYISTEKDFVDSQRTHAWRRYSPFMAGAQRILQPLFGAAFLLYAVRLARTHANGAMILFEAACGLFLVAMPFLRPVLYRRAYRRRSNGAQQSVTFDFEQDAIHFDCPGRSSGQLEWSALTGAYESSTTLLLYTAPALFMAVPKRVLAHAQFNELVAFIREKGVPNGYPDAKKRLP
jgi:hypothetical protein